MLGAAGVHLQGVGVGGFDARFDFDGGGECVSEGVGAVARLAAGLFDAGAWLLQVGAGVYLLTSQAADPNSYLQLLAHGLGAYMVGRGLFAARALYFQARQVELLEQLVDGD